MMSAKGTKIGAFTQRISAFSTQAQTATSPIVFVGKGTTPRQNSLLGPNDTKYPFQGDVAFGGKIDPFVTRGASSQHHQDYANQILENIMSNNEHSLLGLLSNTNVEADRDHLEKMSDEFEEKASLNAADVEIELSVQKCPRLLKKEMRFLFPQLDTASMDVTVMNLAQKTENDMKSWSEMMEEERENLTAAFIMSADAICTTLRKCGYWADFIDPASGRPYLEAYTNHTLFETHDAYKQMGFKIEDLGCCKVLMHAMWGSHAFVGTIFTNAPTDCDIVSDIMKKVNHDEEI
ncbi:unnamed protein product [Caenorhabditis angaria]|uniref:Methylmalonic aciduria and homocystinuria type D protein, mitochondrial n=1 Tax=Caenorhabditis angaria TaxID=860376 RepID=A0A9P1MY65_9PELO|nr:unnamed protein product [Caenorhabditis angaria]